MGDEEVTVDDLLAPLDTNEFGDMKRMAAHSLPPLPPTSDLSQKRANLSAAYDVAKSNVSAWAPIVHETQSQRTSTFENPAADLRFDHFTPTNTEFGSEIDQILEQEKLTRATEQSLEDAAIAHLSEEEMRERVEQLSRLRSLQFFNEQKARRWKKIKSKAFRRLHKRDMAELSLEELAEIDPNAFESRLHKIDVDRAKERATLRHKNTSQWVRRVLARGMQAANTDEKEFYEEQLRLGEELTRKIQANDREADDHAPIENPIEKDKTLKPLFDMKFMREAEERKQREFEDLKREVEGESSGLVTVLSKRPDTPIAKKVRSETSPRSEKIESIVVEVSEKLEPSRLEPTEKVENPWLDKKKKSGRRFVSAASFHQPTDAELAAAQESINLARREEQREVLADAMGLTEEFARDKEAAAMKESQTGLADMSELHLQGWGAWAGPEVVESEGARKRRETLEAKRKALVDEALKERKDRQMPHVVLREGVDQAVERYSIPEVPKFFATPKQLQSQLAFPLGPELNSVTGFHQLIAPDLLAEAGTVIEPIFFTKMQKQKGKILKRNQARKGLEEQKKSST
jgi:U3 small nucleolar RNA-associated protein 14